MSITEKATPQTAEEAAEQFSKIRTLASHQALRQIQEVLGRELDMEVSVHPWAVALRQISVIVEVANTPTPFDEPILFHCCECGKEQPVTKVCCGECAKKAPGWSTGSPQQTLSAQLQGSESLSSVDITVNAKGERQWSVKAYHPTIEVALEQAVKTDEALRQKHGR